MSVALSSTTPAPPAGNTNVTFQADGSGNVSAYVPVGGGSGGFITVNGVLITTTGDVDVNGVPV